MKAVLISIKPKWCDLIRRGRKTVEVRKTCPKLEVPFKVYIYETMDGGRGSGLVFGEFVCIGFDVFRPIGKGISIKRFPALYESCLTLDEIVKYAQGEPVYGWQISQLKLYEEPLKLEDFSRHGFCGMNGTGVCGNADCENYQPSGNYMEPPTCASMAAPCMKRRRAGAMWRKGGIRNEVDSDYRCHKVDCCVRCNLHFCLCDKGWKIPLVSSHPCIPDLSGVMAI